MTINAGNTAFGQSAGYFRIDQDYPSAALSTPAVLKYYTGGLTTNDVTVIRSNGIVSQVIAPQISANVVSNSAYQFQIIFYTNSTFTGTPATSWTIQNPDGASSSNRLFVFEATGGLTNEYDYVWDGTLNGWSLTTQGGAKVEKRYNSTNGVLRTETHLILDGSANLRFQETNTYQTFAWGEELIQHTVGAGTNALTTTWSFYTNSTDTNNYGRLYQMVKPGNNWERYVYDGTGMLTRKVSQYLDAPIPTSSAQENTNRVALYGHYTDTDGFPSQAITNSLNGQQVSWVKLHFVNDQTIETRKQTPDASYSSNYWLNTYTWRNLTPPYVGEPSKTLMPDGTMSFYTYELSENGNTRTNTVTTGQPDAGRTQIIDGTKTITVLDKAGNQISQAKYDVASELLTYSATTLATDSRGRPTEVQYLDGTTETTVFGCCGVESFTDREGITTTYNYDPYTKQVTDVTRAGVTTHHDYDAAGNLSQTTRIGTNSSTIVQNVSTYDTAGRLTSSTPASNGSGLNQTTSYAEYFDASNHRVNTTTNPDGGTRIENYYQDASLFSVTGTAVFPLQYSYSLSTTSLKYGEVTKETKLGSGSQTNEWTAHYQDSLGRNFLTVYSSSSGSPSSQSFYNTNGQLSKLVDPDGLTTLYQYNAKGQLAYTATDMNANGMIDFSGLDRITQTVSDVTTDNGASVNRSRTFVWSVSNSNTSNLVSTTETSVDGLLSWNITYNNGVGATNRLLIGYSPAQASRFVTNVAANGSTTIYAYQYGRPTSITQKDATGAQIGQAVYGYDAHGRQNTATDARNGTTTFYFNNADQVAATLTPSPDGIQSGQVTTNFFDAVGRVWKTMLPDNTSVTNVYYTNGLLQRISGSRTYPVQYTYDAQGRMNTMTTWTNYAGAGGATVTTWNYDGYRGFLTNKVYAGSDGPSYTYTDAGRLESRTWQRTFMIHNKSYNVEADYSYNSAGETSSITYNDSSPTISSGYDRLGRQTAVTNGTAVCTLAYNDAGQLLSEAYSGGPLNGLTVTNAYDNLLRRTAVALASQSATLNQFGYDAASRLQTVSNGIAGMTYTYLANSPLVSQIIYQQNGTNRMTTTKQRDYLNRLLSISSVPTGSGQLPLSHAYAYNNANQRTTVTNADNSCWVYTYDELGQVTSGKKYWADGTPVAGQQFTYDFDDIGNRRSAASGGDSIGVNLRSASYTNNALNQIVSRSVPGYATVLGEANADATVTVNLQRAYRHGSYFSDESIVTNTSAAIWKTFTNIAVLNNGTNADIVTTNLGSALVVKTPETLAYDADGNLLSDGRFTYGWDSQNRLTNITSLSGIPTPAKVKLDLVYDFMGRRIQKVVSTNNGSAYVAQSTNRFVYDGWNLLAELGPNNELIRSYVWGNDLSGAMQGAGGVGGLLAVSYYGAATTNCFVAYDGNGNVAALINAADGSVQAQYEYGPFGELMRSGGAMSKMNPFRFSTKYQDDESELFYYGFRYYNPSTGRWLSRDPIGEEVTRNLYGFVDNDGVNFFDLDGLEKGGEALLRLARQNGSAFGDTPINPINGLQLLVGLPFSVLSGDIFHSDIQKIPKGQCNVLISINGIFTSRRGASNMLERLQQSPRYNGAYPIAAGNRSTYGGDIMQIIGDEFGAIQSASFDLARQINQTYDEFKRNGCCCGSIQVFAHSQGTKVFQRAQSLIKPEARKLICYTGIGGETRISPNGIANAENYRNIYDPVPYAQFLNPVNWPTQPFIDSTTRDAGGHGYANYDDWVQQLPPNCPCKSISNK